MNSSLAEFVIGKHIKAMHMVGSGHYVQHVVDCWERARSFAIAYELTEMSRRTA